MNLVFTSAGDNTSFHNLWLSKDANYDVIVVYYGDNETIYGLYKSLAKHVIRRKGSKFQNFHYYYNNFPLPYDRLFILDDDIIMTVADINKMFDLSAKYNLVICQPSFSQDSIVSHEITAHVPERLLTYTNFVEVNTPLFTKEALDIFMQSYDPVLIGLGIDYMYIQVLGYKKKDAYAVIHAVTCINPSLEQKGIEERELDQIPDVENRTRVWEKCALRNGMRYKYKFLEYSHIFIQPS